MLLWVLTSIVSQFKNCLSSDLLSRLRDARKPDGATEHVGHILTDWVSFFLNLKQHTENNYSLSLKISDV